MRYAVELYFDPETEQKLLKLSQCVAQEGVSTRFLDWKTRPHVTLSCFNEINEADGIQKLDAIAKSYNRMPAYVGSVGMFPETKTIFASPTMTERLFCLQRDVHHALAAYDTTGWEWYLPDRWVPRCPLAMTRKDAPEEFFKASERILREFEVMYGLFTEIGLVKITLPVQSLFTASFMD